MISPRTFSTIVYVWIGIAVVLFPILLKITAPYGRHSKNNWGLMIDNHLGWIIMELPSLLLYSYFVLRFGNFKNVIVILAFIFWFMHYFNRSLVFPFLIRTKGKKMPVVIMVFALFFNFMNASLNGYYIGKMELKEINYFRLILAIILFITGYVINQYHDKILIQLRKNSSNGYKIPYGGLFKYISCPNFFGEIIEWAGFAVLVWSLPAFSFAIWTLVNLVPRAIDHHKWYKNNFSDYPKQRKAILPYIL